MKNEMQRQVEEFHRKFGAPIGETPAFRRPGLRAKLIIEEAVEAAAAIVGNASVVDMLKTEVFERERVVYAPNFVDAIDGIGDSLYVQFGAAIEFGVDMQPIFDEIHRANMAKEGGATRDDGKILKPAGWTPPDILGKLVDQGYIP